MPDSIFFSYSRSDSAFVLKLASDLRKAGATVWLDQLDIQAGKHWDSEIEDALNNANCLLAILSPKSMESNNAMDEISFALEENKKVIPVMLTNTLMPFRLRRLQRVDFTGEYDSAFRQLLSSLNLERETAPGKQPAIKKERKFDNVVSAESQAQQKEQHMWAKACALNTAASYKDYLQDSESQYHQAEARNYIQKLQTEAPGNRAASIVRVNTTSPLHNIKFYVFIAIVVSIVGAVWGAYKLTIGNDQMQDAKNSGKQVFQSIVEKDDSLLLREENKIPASDEANLPLPAPDNTQLTKPENKVPVKVDPVINQNKIPVDIKTTPKEVIPEPKPDTPPPPVAKKPDEFVPPPLPEKKEFAITSKVIVNMKFKEVPERKSGKHDVNFTVTEDVKYNDIIIIRKDATANGSLDIGRILVDLRITAVEGVNGKSIPLKSEKDRIKRHNIKAEETFNAFVQPGTKFTF